VFLTVPDDKIPAVAGELSTPEIGWESRVVFHCSGLLPSAALLPLKERGARTASLHPVQTFVKKERNSKIFQGVYFGLEGDESALSTAEEIAANLGASLLPLEAGDKAKYHTACSISSNLFVALMDLSTSLLKEIGFEEKTAVRVLFPLIKKTLHNVKKFGVSASLSGPLPRGDIKTLNSHLQALKSSPGRQEAYKILVQSALEMLDREKMLGPEKIKSLQEKLEEK
jgi:predicted short-subunit dehydrogenase-like oxidoreductase (DUF2520 family)